MKMAIGMTLLAVSASALAQDNGYWKDSIGQVWRNSSGECWRTASWTPEKIIVGCDGKTAAAPAPTPAPVAAAPAGDGGAAARAAAAAKAAADKAAADAAAAAAALAAAKDTDGDGVPDTNDKCPDTKKGAKVDENGCYIILKETVTQAIDVKFASGSTKVDAAGDAEIQKLAEFMNQYPQTSLEVGGHTDNTGSAAVNRRLSKQRAEAVRQRLIDKFSIDAGRVTAAGYGPDKPVADNGTQAGRDANRRVEGVIKQTVEKIKQ
ncbi:MAG: OmpA family protein [Moraxellaceae bacterium]|nr:OmpA family protein [Moraxellaceae bacterium]